MSLSAFRERFEPIFQATLRDRATASATLVPDPFLQAIIRYPERLAGEGKRIRPFAAWLMIEESQVNDAVLRLLTGLEIFHLFALVHDDIMDRGAVRHGVPTIHLFVADALRQASRIGDLAHHGDSQAILIGDLLFNWAQTSFDEADSGIAPERLAAARRVFRRMIDEVIVGQIVDVDVSTRRTATPELIDLKMRLKTAGYTFIRPLQIGAALAGASSEAAVWAEQFGSALGRAFQIQDDLLDLTTATGETGKSAFTDLQTRQQTHFTQYIFDRGTEAQKSELQSLLGAELTEADRPRILNLFESSGAFVHGRTEIERSFAETFQLIDHAPLSEKQRRLFGELVKTVQARAA